MPFLRFCLLLHKLPYDDLWSKVPLQDDEDFPFERSASKLALLTRLYRHSERPSFLRGPVAAWRVNNDRVGCRLSPLDGWSRRVHWHGS
jgi:hypothetical protein